MYTKKITKYIAWLVFGLMIFVTFFVYRSFVSHADLEDSSKFQKEALKVTQTITNRMSIYESILRGGVSLFNASKSVEREEWRKYVAGLDTDKFWPGIQGIGFSIPIKSIDKEIHIQKIRAEGFSKYTIKPDGTRDEYSTILYLEPFDWRNKRAFGYDMWSNKTRREAMRQARDTGKIAVSGLITLVQETDKDVQRGFLTYLPVYKNNDSKLLTKEDRQRNFVGWVYSPFRADDLFSGILNDSEYPLSIDLYDQEIKSESKLFSNSNTIFTNKVRKAIESIDLHGRKWVVVYHTEYQDNYLSKEALAILFTGLFISLLILIILLNSFSLKLEAELLATKIQNEIQLVLRNTGVGIWTIEIATSKLTWDSNMFLLYEMKPTELPEKYTNWKKKPVHEEDLERVNQELTQAIKGETKFDSKFRIITKDGETKHIVSKADTIKDKNGKITHLVGMNWDFSNEAVLQEKLVNQQQELINKNRLASLGELAAGVGHEINNPLAICVGNLFIIIKGLEEKEYDHKTIIGKLKKVQIGHDRIRKIVDGLRAYARADTDSNEDVSISEAINQTVNLILEIYDKENTSIILENINEGFFIRGSFGKLQQVIMGLISNAKDSTEGQDKREIHISVKKINDQTIELAITDNGTGIPEEIRGKILNPFFTTKEIGKGTGMGLGIISTLISGLGGELKIKSEIGMGSTFSVILPFVYKKYCQEKKQEKEQEKLTGTALVIDDEPGVREILVDHLQELGLEVEEADDGDTGLEKIKIKQYDYICTDMKMKRMDGLEFLQEARKLPGVSSKFFIVTGGVTTNDSEQVRVELRDLVDGYITKPFTVESILKALKEKNV